MKKLYMKQKVFSWKEHFTVKDEQEEDCYIVEGDAVVVGGKKLHIRDTSGIEVAMIQQKLLSLRPRFFVYIRGEQVAEIVKKISLFKPKYMIAGPDWEVKGSIFEHDYAITDQDGEVARLHKVWLSWGDSYELSIADRVDEKMVLAVVLAIDCVLEAQAESAAAADVE